MKKPLKIKEDQKNTLTILAFFIFLGYGLRTSLQARYETISSPAPASIDVPRTDPIACEPIWGPGIKLPNNISTTAPVSILEGIRLPEEHSFCQLLFLPAALFARFLFPNLYFSFILFFPWPFIYPVSSAVSSAYSVFV